jgi:hypothetical protein
MEERDARGADQGGTLVTRLGHICWWWDRTRWALVWARPPRARSGWIEPGCLPWPTRIGGAWPRCVPAPFWLLPPPASVWTVPVVFLHSNIRVPRGKAHGGPVVDSLLRPLALSRSRHVSGSGLVWQGSFPTPALPLLEKLCQMFLQRSHFSVKIEKPELFWRSLKLWLLRNGFGSFRGVVPNTHSLSLHDCCLLRAIGKLRPVYQLPPCMQQAAT